MTSDEIGDHELDELTRQAYAPHLDAVVDDDASYLRTLARILILASDEPVDSVFPRPRRRLPRLRRLRARAVERSVDRELDALIRKAHAPYLEHLNRIVADEARYERTLARFIALASEDTAGTAFPQPQRRPLRRAVAAISASGLLAGAIAAAVVLLSSSAPALARKFPVFARPSSAPNQGVVELLQEFSTHAKTATPISTHYGTGYVMTVKRNSELCLAIPASVIQLHAFYPRNRINAPKARSGLRYVGGCYPFAEAEGKGLILTLAMPRSTEVEVVVVLPHSASHPVAKSKNGTEEAVPVRDGIAAAVLPTRSRLEYTVAGRTFSIALTSPLARAVNLLTPERAGAAARSGDG